MTSVIQVHNLNEPKMQPSICTESSVSGQFVFLLLDLNDVSEGNIKHSSGCEPLCLEVGTNQRKVGLKGDELAWIVSCSKELRCCTKAQYKINKNNFEL